MIRGPEVEEDMEYTVQLETAIDHLCSYHPSANAAQVRQEAAD